MKLFKNEGWKSFWPIFGRDPGYRLTFGGERLITNYQKRQDAGEIVGLFKIDVERHLKISEGLLDDYTAGMSALRKCAVAYAGKELAEIPEDTLRYALGMFFSVRGDVYSLVGMKILEVSGALSAVHEPEVVESVTKIGNVITTLLAAAGQDGSQCHRGETAPVRERQARLELPGNFAARKAGIPLPPPDGDTLCAGLITRGSIPAYLMMFRDMNDNIRAELDIIRNAGY